MNKLIGPLPPRSTPADRIRPRFGAFLQPHLASSHHPVKGHRPIAPLAKAGTAILTLLALGGESAAQTIRYEKGGRQQTYDFKADTASAGRKQRPAAAGLPRGPKNIPWDEPGKISGVPGVLENSATSLPETRARRAARVEGAGSAKALRSAEMERKPKAQRNRSPEVVETRADTPEQVPEQKDVSDQRPRPTAPVGNGPGEIAKAEDQNGEARAKLIEKLRASALAEEQRRLEAEKSRDRRLANAGPRPPTEAKGELGRTTRVQPDPDHTGTVASLQDGSARAEPPRWKHKMCKMLFFGALPGC